VRKSFRHLLLVCPNGEGGKRKEKRKVVERGERATGSNRRIMLLTMFDPGAEATRKERKEKRVTKRRRGRRRSDQQFVGAMYRAISASPGKEGEEEKTS